jgi:hypothetical protein
MKKLKNKMKAQQETQTMDKGTSIDLIDMEKPNVLNDEVASVEVFLEVYLNKQLYGKETSTNLVEVDIPLIATNKVIGHSKDVVAPINTKKIRYHHDDSSKSRQN